MKKYGWILGSVNRNVCILVLLGGLIFSSAFSQTVIIDSTSINDSEHQYLLGFDPGCRSTIHGLTLNYWPSNFSTTSNGIYLDANILSVFAGGFSLPYLFVGIPNLLSQKSDSATANKIDTIIVKNKVNGLSLSTGSLRNNYTKINGVSFSLILNMNTEVNGASLGVITNAVTDFEGFMLSGVNLSERGRGVMVGLLNTSDDFKGIQLGLWNRIGKWGFPFINFMF